MLIHFSCVQLFATLWTVACQAPMGFSRQEYWSGLPCLLPGHLPNPGIEPLSPVLQADYLLLSHRGSPKDTLYNMYFWLTNIEFSHQHCNLCLNKANLTHVFFPDTCGMLPFSSVQLLSRVQLFVTPWITAHQASMSITNSQSSPKLVHPVGDAIQPSHPLLSPSPSTFNLSQHQGLFKWVSSSHQVENVLEFQGQSFQWIFRTYFL